jgi:type IV pilus assembly protein PilP
MNPKLATLLFSLLVLVLPGCGGGDFDDLKEYMAGIKSQPKGHIAPIPSFRPYTAFTYSATALRAPFSLPVKVREITRIGRVSHVEPDQERTKEFLEQFNFESLKMVGTLLQSDVLWVLIDDGEDGIHRVQKDNYLGRNHGKIVEISESYVSVIEIVSTGVEGWIERPRTLKLSETN